MASNNDDVEKGLYDDGYPALGRFMAQDPDNETLIFRRFDSLAALNLLYLQAGLFDVQRRIRDFEADVVAGGDVNMLMSMKRWETFVETVEGSDDTRPERQLRKLILKLRNLMREYRMFQIKYPTFATKASRGGTDPAS